MDRLDLHGIRHEDAVGLTIRFIEDNWASGKEVEIITGHSIKMKDIVVGVLNEYHLEYSTGPALPHIKAHME